MSRVCLRFELPIENTDSKSHIFRSYRRYRRHRWTSYFGDSVYQCSVGGHETKVYITDGVLIYPSVRAEKNSFPADTRRRFDVEIWSKCGRDVDRLNFDVVSTSPCRRVILATLFRRRFDNL